MRRGWIVGVWVVVGALLLGACGGGGGSGGGASDDVGDVESLRPKASKVADQMAAEDWSALRSQFDDTMKKALAEDGMAGVWKSVLEQNGAYKSHGAPTQNASTTKPGITVFDTMLEFERGSAKNRVAFNADGTIAGLFVLNPDAP